MSIEQSLARAVELLAENTRLRDGLERVRKTPGNDPDRLRRIAEETLEENPPPRAA